MSFWVNLINFGAVSYLLSFTFNLVQNARIMSVLLWYIYFIHGDKKNLLKYENILLVRCVAGGNGGGNVVDT